MRKPLLLAIAGCISASVLAQAPKLIPQKMPMPDFAVKYGVAEPEQTVPIRNDRLYLTHPGGNTQATAQVRTVDRIPIGSSFNIYTSLVSEQQKLVADPGLNMVGFVHRIDASKSTNSGDIMMTYSKDGGVTWDSINNWTLAYKNTQYPRGRYPQGGIWNPAGNTDPDQTYAVVSGPITDGSSWVGNYLSTAKTGNKDISGVKANLILDGTRDMARIDFHSTASAVYALGAQYDFDASYSLFSGPYVLKGTWNNTTMGFDYSVIDVNMNFFDDGVNGQIFYTLGNQAWAPDGMLGYVMVIGCDLENANNGNYTVWPIIMKTTDGGNTWSKVNFDFSSISTWADYLFESTDGSYRPFFLGSNGTDMFIDKNNRLHIVCQVISQYTNHPDSILYYLVDANTGTYPQHIFDVYETASGWDAQYLTTIMASPVNSTVTPYSDGLTWDARLSVALSPSRDTYFLLWMDTRPDFESFNLYPDIWGKGWRTNPGKGDTTARRNFTEGTALDANNYWMFVSNYALESGGKFTVPTVTSFSAAGLFDGITTHIHYYVTGIEFMQSDFPIGIPETATVPAVNIYPNPSSGMIEVQLPQNAIRADVSIYSTTGQQLVQLNSLPVQGSKVRIQLPSLPDGMYLLRLNDGFSVHTKSFTVAGK